ncbi:hypothetical protein HDK64DRAFT_42334 [Phyllosticta capitalensis]
MLWSQRLLNGWHLDGAFNCLQLNWSFNSFQLCGLDASDTQTKGSNFQSRLLNNLKLRWRDDTPARNRATVIRHVSIIIFTLPLTHLLQLWRRLRTAISIARHVGVVLLVLLPVDGELRGELVGRGARHAAEMVEYGAADVDHGAGRVAGEHVAPSNLPQHRLAVAEPLADGNGFDGGVGLHGGCVMMDFWLCSLYSTLNNEQCSKHMGIVWTPSIEAWFESRSRRLEHFLALVFADSSLLSLLAWLTVTDLSSITTPPSHNSLGTVPLTPTHLPTLVCDPLNHSTILIPAARPKHEIRGSPGRPIHQLPLWQLIAPDPMTCVV